MSNSGPILDLHFCYEGHAVPVLQGVTLSIAPGERVGLVGCNGVGKSTLLKLLVGILSMQQGTLEVAGLAMQRENLASIRRKVGDIFQDSGRFFRVEYDKMGNRQRKYEIEKA